MLAINLSPSFRQLQTSGFASHPQIFFPNVLFLSCKRHLFKSHHSRTRSSTPVRRLWCERRADSWASRLNCFRKFNRDKNLGCRRTLRGVNKTSSRGSAHTWLHTGRQSGINIAEPENFNWQRELVLFSVLCVPVCLFVSTIVSSCELFNIPRQTEGKCGNLSLTFNL